MRKGMSRFALPALLLTLAAPFAAAPALASDGGGTTAPAPGTPAPAALTSGDRGDTGGVQPGDRAAQKLVRRRKKLRRLRARPVLAAFNIDRPRLFVLGHPTEVSYRIDGRARTVKVRVYVLPAAGGKAVQTVELGEQSTRETHTFTFDASELAPGRYRLRLAARDRRGRALRRARSVASVKDFDLYGHTFPLQGIFSYGGAGSRFGAGRPGHIHQGQDLSAAEGVTVVAPHGGTVKAVQFQRAGAGHYVVVAGRDGRDYVFMHLRTGSIPVAEGQRVRTGQKVGEVGTTGASSGPHLHFEIWVGGWFDGGDPIDPLPLLKSWDRYS
jgi:murein DD-endopeptidase MepM/ murein hydrolase activator NlpD